MFPEEFKKRIYVQEYIDAEALLRALAEPSPVSIRINQAKWKSRPLDSEPVPWCHNGYYLKSRPSYTADPLFHSGSYYPQEASGMFLEQAVLQTAGSLDNIRVLDLCGAPGGKSTLLSDLIGSNSLLVANEVIRQRAQILSETVTKWGSGNTMVTQSDPSHLHDCRVFLILYLSMLHALVKVCSGLKLLFLNGQLIMQHIVLSDRKEF
jgi:16S rRNA C967 or C1407 C5-methylase (RsmB/RsmF family)